MPAKNVVKHYDAPAYYHVYNRGAAGRQLFFNDHDREKFLSLLERHIVGPGDGVRLDLLPRLLTMSSRL